MNTASTLHHGSTTGAMSVSDLQVRLAVLEVELRHAQGQRDEAQSANKALLQVLSSDSTKFKAFADDEVWSSASSQDSLLQEQVHEAKRECELLRRRCLQLQRRKLAVGSGSARTRQVKAFLNALCRQQKDRSTNGTPATASSKTFVDAEADLTKDKDDFDVEVNHLHSHEGDDMVDNDEKTSLNLLDDNDTLTPWRPISSAHLTSVTSMEPAFVYRFKDTKHDENIVVRGDRPSTGAKNITHGLGITTLSVKTADSTSDENDGKSMSSGEHDKVSLTGESTPVTHVSQATTSFTTRARQRHQPVPLDPSREYRMISIRGLPDDVTATDILDQICGGAVVCLSIMRPSFPGMTTTAHVTFFHSGSAASFAAHYRDHVLMIGDTAVQVEHVKTVVSPSILMQMEREFCSRCIMIVTRSAHLTAEGLKAELCHIDIHNEDNIEKIWLDPENAMHVSFVSVEGAVVAMKHLSDSSKYKDCTFQFVIDPCATRGLMVPLPRHSIVTQSSRPMPSTNDPFMHNRLGATFRHPRAVYHQRAGFGLYDDPDFVGRGRQESLVYDDEDDRAQKTESDQVVNDIRVAEEAGQVVDCDSADTTASSEVAAQETQSAGDEDLAANLSTKLGTVDAISTRDEIQSSATPRQAADEQGGNALDGDEIIDSTTSIIDNSARPPEEKVCNKILTTHLYCDCSPASTVSAAAEEGEVFYADNGNPVAQGQAVPNQDSTSSTSSSPGDSAMTDSKGRPVSPGVLALAQALLAIQEPANDARSSPASEAAQSLSSTINDACSVFHSTSTPQPSVLPPHGPSSLPGLGESVHAPSARRPSSSLLNTSTTPHTAPTPLIPARIAIPLSTLPTSSPADAPKAMLRGQALQAAPMRIASPPSFGFSFPAPPEKKRKLVMEREKDIEAASSFFYPAGGRSGRKIVAYDDLCDDEGAAPSAVGGDRGDRADGKEEAGVIKKRKLGGDVKDEELDKPCGTVEVAAEFGTAEAEGVATPTANTAIAPTNSPASSPVSDIFQSSRVRVHNVGSGAGAGLAAAVAGDRDLAALEEMGGQELGLEY